MYIDQLSETRDQMFGLNDNENYFFSNNPIDKAKINSDFNQMKVEKHILYNDYFLSLVR